MMETHNCPSFKNISLHSPCSGLPAGLGNSRQQTFGGHIPKTDAANAEFAHICPGPAANRATVICPDLKFRLFHRLFAKRLFRQTLSSLSVKSGYV